MKVFVRVKGAYEYTKKKDLKADGTIVMVKDKDKKGSWTIRNVNSTALISRKGLFGTKFFVDVMPNASEPIRYNAAMKPEDMPVFDKKESTRYINAKVLRRAGEDPMQQKSNMGLWILAIMMAANIVLTLMASGRIRIG